MNIAQVARRLVRSHWGGTETVILETSKRLLAAGHGTEIICANALAEHDSEIIDGVKVTRVPYFYPYLGLRPEARGQLDQKGGNLFSFALMRKLKQYPGLDLIHLHTAKRVGGIGRHVANKRRIPYIVSLHGGAYDVPAEEARSWTAPTKGAFEWGKVLGWWVGSRRVFTDAAAIICVGEEEKKKTQSRFPHKRVIHLPNGVDPERFAQGDGARFRRQHHISPDAFVMLTIGRIDPQKNQLFGVRLLPDLLADEPGIHLVIVGPVTNRSYHQELTGMLGKLGVNKEVTVISGLEAASQELVDAYHGADLFVLPSIHEPFGIVILEAWAAGLPVMASRVGGIPSFVEEGRDGVLFEPNDREGFLREFRPLLQNRQRLQTLAEAGRQKAREQYGWDRVTQRLIHIYEEVSGENPLRQ